MARPTSQIYAGDTLEWNEIQTGYASGDGYTLHFRLINGTGKQDFNGVTDGVGGWDFTVNPTFSNFAASGSSASATAYVYAKLVSDPTQVTTLEVYGITIFANGATATSGIDLRTQNRIALDNAYDIRNQILSNPTQSRAAFGRSWAYKDLEQLGRMIARLERDVWAEDGNAPRGTYFASFIRQ